MKDQQLDDFLQKECTRGHFFIGITNDMKEDQIAIIAGGPSQEHVMKILIAALMNRPDIFVMMKAAVDEVKEMKADNN